MISKMWGLLAMVVMSLGAADAAESCSSGDTAYMCENLNDCWGELGFSSRDDLKYLCEIQGYTYDDSAGEGVGAVAEDMVTITTPPSNLTIPEGTSAAFRCSANNAVKIVIQKTSEMARRRMQEGSEAQPTQQTTIQEIDVAMKEHEGWYTCTAYGVGDTSVSAEAYLEMRDVCANHDCVAPKVCSADKYMGTYECVCPGECEGSFDPVCGTDCQSYFNECTMKKETCERDVTGVTVHSKGLCSFTPAIPEWVSYPETAEITKGDTMTLTAAATGTPDPEYQWFLDGEKVGTGATFTSAMDQELAGDWSVKASVCLGSHWAEQMFSVSMATRDFEVTEPDQMCCKVYGDPHVLTFDGMAYDYMGIGTFVIAQDAVEGRWMVYGGFDKCGDKTKQLSCVTSITVFYEAETVQFLRMWRVNNKGDEFMIPLGQTRNIGGMQIENKNLEYIITLGDTGVTVKWDGIITSQVCVSKCVGNTAGLCANANCNPDDEFLGRGFMNPYTQSFEAESSSEFGNSWSIDPDNTVGEPEDGSMGAGATRYSPCDSVPVTEKVVIEARCNSIRDLSDFSVVSMTKINMDVMVGNCIFDGCAGLIFGAGCVGAGDTSCPRDIEALIAAAMAAGMSREEAVATFGNKGLDSACMMGLNLARELQIWGADIGKGWRTRVVPACPTDEEIGNMRICPT